MQKMSLRFFHYLVQSFYACLFIGVVLYCLDLVPEHGLLWAVGASSVASSTFIVFARPCAAASEGLRMIGAYLLSILIGIVCAHLAAFLWQHFAIKEIHALELGTAISVGLMTLLMTILHFQHPPAASMALVLTLEPWGFSTVMIVLMAIFVLAGISILFRPYFRDLMTR